MRACQMKSKGVGKGAVASRAKTSYNYKECFDLVDRLEHETFDYLERRQRNSDYELTEDALFILAVDRIYDSLSDYQLLELYRYFNGRDATVKHLTVKQTTQVLDTIADMVMSHFDDLKTGHVKTSYTDFGDFSPVTRKLIRSVLGPDESVASWKYKQDPDFARGVDIRVDETIDKIKDKGVLIEVCRDYMRKITGEDQLRSYAKRAIMTFILA